MPANLVAFSLLIYGLIITNVNCIPIMKIGYRGNTIEYYEDTGGTMFVPRALRKN